MGDTWITDLRHFLNEDGQVGELPGPARSLAEYLCSIVDEVTARPVGTPHQLRIPCRRRPGRKPCRGVIVACLPHPSYQVEWLCPKCQDEGIINGWQASRWDRLDRTFTKKQGQYLSYIHYYTKIHRRPPAETDMQWYFRVSPPTVHQMVLRLEKLGLIARERGTPRSIRVLVPPKKLPKLL